MKEALMAMADHIFSFQAKLIAFTREESQKFQTLLQLQREDASADRQVDFVNASLNFNGSMAIWTMEQLHALRKRLRVQAKVVSRRCFRNLYAILHRY